MTSRWRIGEYQGVLSYIGEVSGCKIEILPEYGGKTVSFFDKVHQKEWLDTRQGLHPVRPLNTLDDWSNFDCMGWDELFPTVDPCHYPHPPWQDVFLGEHGELWRLAWKAELVNDGMTLRMMASGRWLPYQFEKKVSFLKDTGLYLEYGVKNLSDHPIFGLWLMHPLLNVAQGTTVELNPPAASIEVSNTLGGRLGSRNTIHPWPRTADGVSLDTLGKREDNSADKWFVRDRQRVERVRVRDAESGAILTFLLKDENVPYLGVWSNCGGWNDDHNLAVEPSTGYLDRLDEAAICGRAMRILPGTQRSWTIELRLE